MSPSWSSPLEVQKDSAIFNDVIFAFFGLYVWEILNSLSFDWAVFTGKRAFKIVYFLCRYSMLWCLIGVILTEQITSKINCQALFTFSQLTGNVALGTASLNLMLRTIAVWERQRLIVGLLTVLALGHWGILLHGIITVIAKWMPAEGACAVTSVPPVFLSLLLIYTMCIDLVVLVLTVWRLAFETRSRIMSLLFRDGIIYFVIAFTANIVPVVFALLNWNPVMSIMFNTPAAVASCIAACRAVRRLTEYGARDVQIQISVPRVSTFRARTNPAVRSDGTSDYMTSHMSTGVRPMESKVTRFDPVYEEGPSSSEAHTPSSDGTDGPCDKRPNFDLEKSAGLMKTRPPLEMSTSSSRSE